MPSPFLSALSTHRKPFALLALAALLPVLLWLPGMHDTVFTLLPREVFLPLHAILTSLYAVVAFAIFFVGWYSFHRAESPGFFHALLGITFLIVGSLDLLHAWTFVGMPAFFSNNSLDRTVGFWILARAFECLGLLGAIFIQRRGLTPHRPYRALGTALFLIAISTFRTLNDPCRLFNGGPTPLFHLLEALLVLGFSLAFLLILCSSQEDEQDDVPLFLLGSALFSAYAELCFLNHGSLTDILSLIGFLYKGLAYLLIFRALVVSGIVTPYSRLEMAIALYRRANLQAQTDGMTGLLNHECFLEHLNRQFQESRRYNRPLSLIMIDLDHFKRVNDTFGHRTGDEILQAVAEAVRGSIRDCDYASRYGGEELALLLPETSEEQAMVLADRLRRRISTLHGRLPGVGITASFGVAQVAEKDSIGEDLLDRADQALYQAKGAGRNRVCCSGRNLDNSIR